MRSGVRLEPKITQEGEYEALSSRRSCSELHSVRETVLSRGKFTVVNCHARRKTD